MAQKIIFRLLITGLCLSAAMAAGAANINTVNVYGFYSETFPGMKYDLANPGVGGIDGAIMGFYGSYSLSVITPPAGGDGIQALQVTDNGTQNQAGVYMQFGNPSEVATNMSEYQNGTYTFMIRANAEVSITIKDANGFAEKFLSSYVSLDNQWHQVSIPLTQANWGYTTSSVDGVTPTGKLIDFTTIKNIAFATKWLAPGVAGRTFAIDNVLWIKPNTAATLTAALKNIVGNGAASSITWSGVTPGTTKWKAADQYIELDFDYFTPNWGIQIYTDNKAADANPLYRGTNNPAGLVGQTATGGIDPSSSTLAMCWRVVDNSTTTLNIQRGAPGFPDRLWENTLGNGYPCFLWMEDRGTKATTTPPSSGFSDSADYVTVWDSRGIQHAESTWGPGTFSPNYVYLGADFSTAITPFNYKTNKLVVELFYE